MKALWAAWPEQVESRSVKGRTVWTITLEGTQDNQRNALADMGINHLSADHLATLRARLLLLDEQPVVSDQRGLWAGLESWIYTSALNTRTGIFPKFWERSQVWPDLFPPLARLWALYHLKINQPCEHVLELRLGPLEADRSLRVAFRGRRHKRYINEPATEIRVDGQCRLTAGT